VLLAARLLDRGAHAGLGRRLLAAAAAGLAADLALELHCPIDDPGHLLAGHAAVGVALAAACALLRRVPRGSARPA